MPRQTYLPGAWHAVVSTGGVALLPAELPASLADRIWLALEGGEGLTAVLEALTAAYGTSLSSIPPFAVAVLSGADVRLAVRGALRVGVTEQGAAPFSVSGADITTWSERVVSGAESLLFVVADSALDARGEPPAAEWLSIGSGVVLASSVRVEVVGGADESTRLDTAVGGTTASTADAESLSVVERPEPEIGAAATVAEVGPVSTAQSPDELEPVQPTSVDAVHEPVPDDEPAEPVQPTSVGEVLDDSSDPGVEDTRTDIPDEAYDHLWGETVVKSVESAAVRDLDDDEADAAPASAPTAASANPATSPAAPATPPDAPASAPANTPPAPADWTAPPATDLIDRVPGFSSAIGAPAPAAAPATPPDDLDHDGLTVTVSELDALRRLGDATPLSHGTIRLSTGDVVTLDRTIVVGRRPRANRVDADRMPTLVTVPSPQQDISRNHLEVRIEGRHVLAVDLETTNGSVLHRDGTPPARLTPREPVLLLENDVIDIGDGVTLLFEGLS